MSTRKKVIVVAAALVALALAGVAGAVIRLTVLTIGDGKYARLSGTDIYCLNTRNGAGRRTLVCSYFVPVAKTSKTRRVRGTYGFSMNELGISVHRATGPESVDYFRSFNNP